jgi:hypothetical protein
MANEIIQDIKFSATKNGATVSFANRNFFDMYGSDTFQGTQLISESTIDLLEFGSVNGSPRTLIIKNLDTTNTIYIGGDSLHAEWLIKILPSDCCVISPQTSTLYATASTSPCRVQIIAVEDD